MLNDVNDFNERCPEIPCRPCPELRREGKEAGREEPRPATAGWSIDQDTALHPRVRV